MLVVVVTVTDVADNAETRPLLPLVITGELTNAVGYVYEAEPIIVSQ